MLAEADGSQRQPGAPESVLLVSASSPRSGCDITGVLASPGSAACVRSAAAAFSAFGRRVTPEGQARGVGMRVDRGRVTRGLGVTGRALLGALPGAPAAEALPLSNRVPTEHPCHRGPYTDLPFSQHCMHLDMRSVPASSLFEIPWLGTGRGGRWGSTSYNSDDERRALCYTGKAPNAWHRRGTPQTGNTNNQLKQLSAGTTDSHS